MPPAYEILLLNTAVPQIQAAQSGDTYVVPRDIAFSAALTLSAGTANGVPYLNGSKVLTSGSALTFDGTNFGIGGSASFKLDVISSSDVAGAIRSTGSSNSASLILSNGNGTTSANYSYIRYFNNSASPQEWRVGTYGDARFVWQNITAGSEAMCLTSTGLGIGTSLPSGKLHTVQSNGVNYFESPGISSIALQFVTNSTNRYRIGIPSGSTDLQFLAGGTTETMRLDASGNLGIGTSSPGYNLEVAGAVRATVAIRGNFAGGTDIGHLRYLNANGSIVAQMSAQNTTGGASDSANLSWLTVNSGSLAERARITSVGNFSLGGTADRATTVGTKALNIFDGTAPVGTLANGISIYSSSGEAYVMDAAGNATLFSPHDVETNEWIFRSKHTPTGKVLRIDVERLLRFVNDHFGLDAVKEFVEE